MDNAARVLDITDYIPKKDNGLEKKTTEAPDILYRLANIYLEEILSNMKVPEELSKIFEEIIVIIFKLKKEKRAKILHFGYIQSERKIEIWSEDTCHTEDLDGISSFKEIIKLLKELKFLTVKSVDISNYGDTLICSNKGYSGYFEIEM